jgi:hypothetical protein
VTINSIRFTSLELSNAGGCGAGTVLQPQQSCAFNLVFAPNGGTGVRPTAAAIIDASGFGPYEFPVTGVAAAAGATTVTVVEFYNATLDHYFITWNPAEIANLDAGLTPTRWARTGTTFKAYASAEIGTSPVCRFYIPPAKGDSHFFGRGTVECNGTLAANPSFVLEDAAFMRMFLPAAGTCGPGTTPVYRAFSNRADANHRYMTDRAIRDQMVLRGWVAEGDGPDLVVMCAPQ